MAKPGNDRRIDNIEFAVSDIARSRTFYGKAFGWTFTDFLMGQIGAPITEAALLHIKLATRDQIPVSQFERRADEISRAHLGRTSRLVDDFISGTIDVF